MSSTSDSSLPESSYASGSVVFPPVCWCVRVSSPEADSSLENVSQYQLMMISRSRLHRANRFHGHLGSQPLDGSLQLIKSEPSDFHHKKTWTIDCTYPSTSSAASYFGVVTPRLALFSPRASACSDLIRSSWYGKRPFFCHLCLNGILLFSTLSELIFELLEAITEDLTFFLATDSVEDWDYRRQQLLELANEMRREVSGFYSRYRPAQSWKAMGGSRPCRSSLQGASWTFGLLSGYGSWYGEGVCRQCSLAINEQSLAIRGLRQELVCSKKYEKGIEDS